MQKKIHKKTRHTTILNSQKAMISVDFLFSFLIVMGLTYLILALAFSLSFVELTQYISFSAARSYYAANETKSLQTEQAKKKYSILVKNSVWAHFFNKLSWFKIDNTDGIVKDPDYSFSNQFQGRSQLFTGVSTTFTTKLLAFNLPFIGSTYDATKNKEPGFITKISSYLGREPSAEECRRYGKERSHVLRRACVDCSNFKVIVIADNGC